MTFDARSKERLEALGRTLPKILPSPDSCKALQGDTHTPGGTQGKAEKLARHRLEREEDPAELFRALMKASPDGSVPPHLLDRLRELEGSSPLARAKEPSPSPSPQGANGSSARRSSKSVPRSGQGTKDQDLYTAFAHLLLEEDDHP